MLRSLNALKGYHIAATDGEVGKVHDFFFDDEFWIVRYLVVDTGHWLPGRKVLLTPGVLHRPEWRGLVVRVNLTREQVQDSPDIDTDKPVSRQQELELHRHYGWPYYWPYPGIMPGFVAPVPPPDAEEGRGSAEGKDKRDPHLRSVREVTGYHVQASDGEIGHVEDFIADDESWTVRYLVVATRNWLPGRSVLVSPYWVASAISWAERKVNIIMTRENIRNSPLFDPAGLVNREYETRLYDYYGRPGYWVKPEDKPGSE